MNKLSLTAILLGALILPIGFYASESETNPSHLEDNKTPIEKEENWLADLDGVPNWEEIEQLSKHVDEVMKLEKNKNCTSIDPRLRKMIFLHFAIYQHFVNQRSFYLSEANTYHWAHVFGMLLKESSGDPTNVTSMTGRTYSTYQAKSDLDRWRKMTTLSQNGKIALNYQTNFGLTQLSVDRLFVALRLAREPVYFKGEKHPDLNTAIAIRRLIWFYQDFAQGRLIQEHDRIHRHERGNPEYSTRLAFGTSMALLLCGTHYMFREGYSEKEEGVANLTEAMTSIAYCKLGSSKEGYGNNQLNEKCFAEWVTLCPTLNFDIAMLTPMQYFSTRNAAPVCQSTFNALLTKKSENPSPHKTHKKKAHQTKNVIHENDKSFGWRAKKLLHSALSALKHLVSGTKQP